MSRLLSESVRSDTLMRGYLNNPEDTAFALRDEWMHTGDAGTIDEAGFYSSPTAFVTCG